MMLFSRIEGTGERLSHMNINKYNNINQHANNNYIHNKYQHMNTIKEVPQFQQQLDSTKWHKIK